MAPAPEDGQPKKPSAPRPGGGPGTTRKRRRGGRKRRKAVPNRGPVAKALAQGAEKDSEQRDEASLSAQEAREMQGHFTFLRMHRKVLRLKVNAAEDLLLNGVHEPTDRAACLHLLGKVDRSSVISACARLEPAAAAKLLTGIVLFSSDIEYVLLLLEKFQLSAPPEDATAALAQGLERIDFDAVSSGQMRRVLSLIVELFGEHERPELLLGLLESRSFRNAFDKAIEGLPEPLAALVVPLRAAQAVILHGKPNRYASRDLARGVGFLLSGSAASLRRRPSRVNQRLATYGMQACGGADHPYHRQLETLVLDGFSKRERLRGKLGLTLARHLLADGYDGAATRILKELVRDHPDFDDPKRWLARVQHPARIGRFAPEDTAPARQDALSHHERRPGFWLATMQPAWVQVGREAHVDTMTGAAQVLSAVSIPNLVPLLDSGTMDEGDPYFVTPNPGRPLDAVLGESRGVDLGEAIRLCLEGAVLLSALAAVGVAMHDADPARFALGAGGAVWLVDVSGAVQGSAESAGTANLGVARDFCSRVLSNSTRFLVPGDLTASIESAGSCHELVRTLARSGLLGSRTVRKGGGRES